MIKICPERAENKVKPSNIVNYLENPCKNVSFLCLICQKHMCMAVLLRRKIIISDQLVRGTFYIVSPSLQSMRGWEPLSPRD